MTQRPTAKARLPTGPRGSGVCEVSTDEPLDLLLLDGIQLYDDAEDPEAAASERKKKREAIETMDSYGVYEDVSEETAEAEGLKYIRARWEH